ncbi:MAG: 3-phosphoglycerate dehydrogenase [Variibacter sp.]|nr:3-phosphoglycerate dehydrogenase [Variibacter sp.]
MKALFLDCNEQLGPIFARVLRPDDPAIAVNYEPYDRAAVPRLLAGYEICLNDHSYLPTEVVAQCPALRHIVFLGTGAASYMDIAALNRRGITVHTIKGYGDTAVAEHTIALMFAAARDIARMDRDIRGGAWRTREGVQLLGKTLGVIGLGGIGREVVRIAAGLGMKVLAWNRTPVAAAPATLAPLEEVLAQADVLSLHLVLNDETRNFLDAERLAKLKPGCILVNTARGALVDEKALLAALESGRIRHAALDVYHAEPLKPDHPLARLPNVTLSAHSAFRTQEASETLLRRGIDIVRRIVEEEGRATHVRKEQGECHGH